MSKLVSLESLIGSRQLWRGQPANLAPSSQPTGHAALDAALPTDGWPEASLTELLLPMHGVGELELMWPTLARLSQGSQPEHAQPHASPAKASRAQASHAYDGGIIVLIDPPFLPYPPAWRDAGVALSRLQVIRAHGRDALWAAEQCLRSGACAAVLCWPQRVDDRALRRLQVAAETGQCLGFALRDSKAALNPSPAALRIAIDSSPRQLRVLKCRGGNVPTRPIAFPLKPRAVAEAAAVTPVVRERGTAVPADGSIIRLMRPVEFSVHRNAERNQTSDTGILTLLQKKQNDEVFCGKGFSPDAMRPDRDVGTNSVEAEAPPTKDVIALAPR